MASPQKENGYTSIANETMEALAGIRISGEARQCLDIILRKTYGFNKTKDRISLSQFCLLSKMIKPNVCRGLLKLKGMNIVIIKKDNQNITSYRFNKDFDTWKPLSKKITVIKKDNQRYQKRQSALSKKIHTKETITKETITKEISSKKGKQTFGNEDVNKMLTALKEKIGIEAFVDSRIERNMAKHCVNLIGKIGKELFVARLDTLLGNSFTAQHCNKIKFVYNNIKGFKAKKKLKKLIF